MARPPRQEILNFRYESPGMRDSLGVCEYFRAARLGGVQRRSRRTEWVHSTLAFLLRIWAGIAIDGCG